MQQRTSISSQQLLLTFFFKYLIHLDFVLYRQYRGYLNCELIHYNLVNKSLNYSDLFSVPHNSLILKVTKPLSCISIEVRCASCLVNSNEVCMSIFIIFCYVVILTPEKIIMIMTTDVMFARLRRPCGAAGAWCPTAGGQREGGHGSLLQVYCGRRASAVQAGLVAWGLYITIMHVWFNTFIMIL